MNKKTNERPVFPFVSIIGQEEMCEINNVIYKKHTKQNKLITISNSVNLV